MFSNLKIQDYTARNSDFS